MPFEDGPYIQAACACDYVLRDDSGSLSLIRIIDTLTHTEGGPDPPENMPAFSYAFYLVVMLKSGKARGRSDLKIVPELPTGATQDPRTFTVHFEGEEKGHQLVMKTNFEFTIEGLYWFNVHLGEDRLTRIPFRVKYNRVIASLQQKPGVP